MSYNQSRTRSQHAPSQLPQPCPPNGKQDSLVMRFSAALLLAVIVAGGACLASLCANLCVMFVFSGGSPFRAVFSRGCTRVCAVCGQLLLVCAFAASAYTWDSCGTRYDRLVTQSLSFSAYPSLTPGSKATIQTQVCFRFCPVLVFPHLVWSLVDEAVGIVLCCM